MYTVVLNSDRVHITNKEIPVETIMYSNYGVDYGDDRDIEEGKPIAVGVAVLKALAINEGIVTVKDLSQG